MKEQWKDVVGFEGYYQVSNKGCVKSLDRIIKYSNGYLSNHKGRILKQEVSKNKYNRVTLSLKDYQKRYLTHRLVLTHFIPNPEKKPCVNHKDGNGFNNNVTNLEWCTYSENERHSYDVLKKVNANRKLSKNDIKFIKDRAVKGRNGNIKALARLFKVAAGTIYNILKNKTYV